MKAIGGIITLVIFLAPDIQAQDRPSVHPALSDSLSVSVQSEQRDSLDAQSEVQTDRIGKRPNQTHAKGKICSAPQIEKSEELLDSILLSYREHAAVVDFWATWCGPCRRAMSAIHPLKEEVKSQKVDFIYITNETSNEKEWQETIRDIQGFHYRISNDQWTRLINRYTIRGIPTYMLFNRQGMIYYRHEGYPGNNTLRDEINAILQEE